MAEGFKREGLMRRRGDMGKRAGRAVVLAVLFAASTAVSVRTERARIDKAVTGRGRTGTDRVRVGKVRMNRAGMVRRWQRSRSCASLWMRRSPPWIPRRRWTVHPLK